MDLVHRHLPAAANGFTRALLVDPGVRACAATGARRRRNIGPPSRTTTTTTAAATASTLKTRRRTLRRTCHRTWRRTLPSGPERRTPPSPRHHRRRRRLCAARAEIGAQLGNSVAFAIFWAQLGSSVAFGSGCGQALPLPKVPRKAPLCLLTALRAGLPFSWVVTSGGPPFGRSLSKDGTRVDIAKDFCRLVGGVFGIQTV